MTAEASVADPEVGHFTSADRSATVKDCLPLLATYFADAPTWGLSTQSQLATSGTDDTDALASFIRMRVAIAQHERLQPILRHVLERPSFQYARQREESVGALTGTLDIPAYIRSRTRPESPRRYPVRAVCRRHELPENVLAACAALWVAREMQDAPLHLLPPNAPERRAVEDARTLIGHWLGQPALAESRSTALSALRNRRTDQLLEAVRERIDSGRVAVPDRYAALVEWYQQLQADAAAHSGEIEWAFYDEQFDTKLFEIWSLAKLVDALESEMGAPSATASLMDRGRRAVCTWNLGSAKVRVYFQAALARLSDEATQHWAFTEPEPRALGGFPDLAVTVERAGAPTAAVIVDPKLRRRKGPPTDELYKIIGYFGNLPPQPIRGSIVFYAPGRPRTYKVRSETGGDLLAVGVDPADAAQCTSQFKLIAELVRDTAGVDPGVLQLLRAASDGDDDAAVDARAAVQQREAARAMVEAAANLPGSVLDPIRKSTQAHLGETWDALGEDAQTMLVTAEYFGLNAPSDADHSGPLLGLAAACETLVHTLLLAPSVLARPDLVRPDATLGSAIRWLADATDRRPRFEEGQQLAADLGARADVDLARVRHLISDLRTLNVDYRIPAAHREVVAQNLWRAGRSLVMNPESGLLVRLVQSTSTANDNLG